MVTSASQTAVEWERAKQIQISVDLISVAKQELGFLAVVDGTPALKNRQVLERAINRYLNCWLPLARKHAPSVKLLPPLDCAWVWHCHKLNPVQYAKDCQQLFGNLVDVAAPEPSRAREVEAATITEWTKAYPGEPYHFIRAGERPVEQLQSFAPLKNSYTVAYDLIGAIGRQTSFYFQVCRPWMYEDRFLQAALERYRGFLHLIKIALEKQSKGGPRPFVVPTYDIDLLWHSHQLCPTAYRADTVRCMGKILDHDDSDSDREAGAKLQTSFVDTCDQWLATYGTVYEHAGSLYRGPEPARLAPPMPNDGVVTGIPVNQEQRPIFEGNNKLSRRQTLQVNLVVLGAANIYPTPKPGRKSHFYVRITALRRCPGLRLTTNPIECSSDTPVEVAWNEGFSLQAEVSTQGLRMELMTYTTKKSDDGQGGFFAKIQRKVPGLKKKPKCLGEVSIEWERDLLGSAAGLSLTQWISAVPKMSKKSGSSKVATTGDPPQLHYFVSITPPTPAPYIFRMLQAPVTDDTGLQVAKLVPVDKHRQEGRWITRTAVDHCGQEQFVIRTRWARGATWDRHLPARVSMADTVIHVHQGALQPLGNVEAKNYQRQRLVRAPRTIISSAKQLPEGTIRCRKWSLFDGAASLTVNKPTRSNGALNCEVEGNLGYPMRLLSGRWLEYEVDARGVNPYVHEREEAKYLTLVRYTPDAPMGKATALINWHSAAIEVKPEESVVLVLLVSSAISVTLLQTNFQYPSSQGSRKSRQGSSDGHLGAMQIQRNGLSERWNRRASNQDMYWETNSLIPLYALSWWELSTMQMYAYGAGGALCGGGACGGGACGGGACGSGGGCGGGCGGGGCGGGGCGGGGCGGGGCGGG